MKNFIQQLEDKITARHKMTNPLYQVILSGKATPLLLQDFVIHRFPIKNFWTRNILGIASRIDDYKLRKSLVENIYEEETGALTSSQRHLNSFVDFGKSVGVSEIALRDVPLLPETKAVIDHNVSVCNSHVHFTAGVASVLLLMEGQPPIVSKEGKSMEWVMRNVYMLPRAGYEFFTHHAANESGGVSDLEDEHAEAAKNILKKYCTTEELQELCLDALDKAIELRHKHFDAILALSYKSGEQAFRYVA